ncbi:MAG: hypothetical protein LBP52_00320 [Burkholderiaceae bacterium]|nr:hypothetical protein [Burkholderiaceae bacterium]
MATTPLEHGNWTDLPIGVDWPFWAAVIGAAIGLHLLHRLLARLWRRRRDSATPLPLSLPEAMGALLTIGMVPLTERLSHWRQLLLRLFGVGQCDALAMDALPPGEQGEAGQRRGRRVRLVRDGTALWIPATGGMPPLLLHSQPADKRPLFVKADRRLAQRLCDLVGKLVRSNEAYHRGVAQERLRIADDLHDDLGASLLALVHASSHDASAQEVATVARRALDEMRLAVRNMKALPIAIEDMVADWRAETVSRLSAAGVEHDWDADLPAAGGALLVQPRVAYQLTRVLREAVSNVLRHSQATRCTVRVEVSLRSILLKIEDNGRGIDWRDPAIQRGHGLFNIERRVLRMQGKHSYQKGQGTGTLLLVRVPFEPIAATAADPEFF